MDLGSDLITLTPLDENVKSMVMSSSEKMTYLHQTMLAISNILDLEENKVCHSAKSSVPENSGGGKYDGESPESRYPSSILQLYKQRLILQGKGTGDHQSTCESFTVPRESAVSDSDHTPFAALLRLVSNLRDLCKTDWKHLFETRRNSESKGGQNPDPFSTGCCIFDEQSRTLVMQQLEANYNRCQKLAEQEAKDRNTPSMEAIERRDDADDGGKCSAIGELMTLDECIWRIEERLSGYEEGISRLLTDLKDWKTEQWIKTLEENSQLLIEPRWVKRLFEVGLEFTTQTTGVLAEDEVKTHMRLLKLSSQCFAALPLPLQSILFQWLWDQPKGCDLFQSRDVINVDRELNRVFNQLVTGSGDGQLIEISRDFCSVALHSPSATLCKAVAQAVSNTDAGKLICKVLQCIPFLAHLANRGAPYIVAELTRLLKSLEERKLSSAEELNMFRFFEGLMQSYQAPANSESPMMHPPLVHPLLLAEFCIWPFLGPASANKSCQHIRQQATPTPEDQQGVPIHIVLKLLDLVLENGLASCNDQGLLSFDASLCFSTMLCLCHLLEDCIAADIGDITSSLHIKELTSLLLHKISKHTKEMSKDDVLSGVEWLLGQTADLDWTVGLTINALFSDKHLSCSKNIKMCVGKVAASFACQSGPSMESVSKYVTWSSSMIAFFLGCRISPQLTELFLKSLPKEHLSCTASTKHDFYRAVCLALAQVLPSSIPSEWLTILGALDCLIAEGVLQVHYTAHFMSSLPMFDLTVGQRPLQLSQVFTTVMQLLCESSISDWPTVHAWQHITKNFTHVMKEILDTTTICQSSPSSSTHMAQVFLIGQLFCQSCLICGRVPESGSEQIFVWCLELLMRMEEMMGCHGNDDAAVSAAVNDAAYHEFKTMSRAVESLPNVAQKSTLQQKLGALL